MKSAGLSEKSKGRGFGVLAGYDIRRFWMVPALLTLFLMASCPVACLLVSGASGERGSAQREFIESMGKNEYFVCEFFIFVMAVAAAMGVFGYLQRQSEANLIHALPLSRTRLFTVHYGTGLAMLLIPVLLTGLIMMMFGYPLPIIRWIALSCFMCWVFYSIAVFAGMVSGNLFMHLFNYVFFTFLPVLALSLAGGYGEMLLKGYTTPDLISRMMSVITPPAALYGIPHAGCLVGYGAASLGLTILALGIYLRRAVECTGDSLVFSWTRLAFVGLIAFLGALAMGGLFLAVSDLTGPGGRQTAMYFGIAFGFAASFLVISLIVYRGIGIFRKKNLMAGAAALIVTVLFVGVLSGDVIGYSRVQFAPEEFDRVSLSSSGESVIGHDRFDPAYYMAEKEQDEEIFSQPMIFKSRENIEAICHMQNVLAQAEPAGKPSAGLDVNEEIDYEEEYGTLRLEGQKKSGGTIRREYGDIDEETWKQILPDLESIFASAEFKDMFRLSRLRYTVQKIEVSAHEKGTDRYMGDMTLSSAQREALIRALDKDLAPMTYDRCRSMERISSQESPSKDYCYISIELADPNNSLIGITVSEDSPAAWAWLEKNFRPAAGTEDPAGEE